MKRTSPFFKSRGRTTAAAILSLFALVGIFGYFRTALKKTSPHPSHLTETQISSEIPFPHSTQSPSPQAASGLPSTSRIRMGRTPQRPSVEQIQGFLSRRFGLTQDKYELAFSVDGMFGHLRGKRTTPRGQPPLDPSKSIEIAREIVDGTQIAGDLAEGSHLEIASVRGKNSGDTEVFFEQKLNGIPLEPRSDLHVVLQSDGTPIGVASTLTPRLTGIQSVEKLSEPQARSKATSTTEALESGRILPPKGGRKIYWIYDGAGKTDRPISEARVAYEYTVHEYLVIVDAATGEVLYRRKKSHH